MDLMLTPPELISICLCSFFLSPCSKLLLYFIISHYKGQKQGAHERAVLISYKLTDYAFTRPTWTKSSTEVSQIRLTIMLKRTGAC